MHRARAPFVVLLNSKTLVPARNPDLHGNAPDKHSHALILIDVINDLEFDHGDALLQAALPMADRIAALARRARAAAVPVIYVNDNFGKWQSQFETQVEHCLNGGVRGKPIAAKLLPEPSDYFVLKPKHSAFYSTMLETLLRYLGTQTLILTGMAAHVCVLFTANDAYMRDYRLMVPEDCMAASDPEDFAYALKQMRNLLRADTRPSTEIVFPTQSAA